MHDACEDLGQNYLKADIIQRLALVFAYVGLDELGLIAVIKYCLDDYKLLLADLLATIITGTPASCATERAFTRVRHPFTSYGLDTFGPRGCGDNAADPSSSCASPYTTHQPQMSLHALFADEDSAAVLIGFAHVCAPDVELPEPLVRPREHACEDGERDHHRRPAIEDVCPHTTSSLSESVRHQLHVLLLGYSARQTCEY